MINFKQTAISSASVLLVSSLAVSQLGEFIKRPVDAELLTHGVSASLTVDDPAVVENIEQQEASVETSDITETLPEEDLKKLVEAKSTIPAGYVVLTSGTLSVKSEPSSESETTDVLDCLKEVKILNTVEGWTFIEYDSGKKGYVPSSTVTDTKEEAEFAAKHYDNYMRAKITPKEAAVVRVRKSPSTSAPIVAELESGSTVLMLWNEGDFVKVIYGPSYEEGFMIASALTMTYEWESKESVENARAEIKRKAEKEAAKKKAQEEAARKAQEEAKKASAAAASKKSSTKSYSAPVGISNAPASSKGQAIVNVAKKYLGVKYVYGGSTPSGFDCSGFVKYVCAKNGISLSRTSASQARQGVTVSRNNLQPGDLLFFAKNGRVHHVGIYVGGGMMIHAPHTGSKIKYDSINSAYRQKEFYCAKRVY